MTVTKTASALCGAALVLLLGNWVASGIYHVAFDGTQSYVVDTGEADSEPIETVEIDFATLLAAAEVDKGGRLFRQCSACHKLDNGANGTGPHLFNIVNRPKGSVAAFGYSASLAAMEGDWSPENLSAFIENPREYVPGTSMSYSGMRKIEDRANLIAYLDSLSN